jgi:2-polyprenyl-3-methyl-5-hydroxy-6-metoxy-1,4-benzoquinol methylase
MANIASGPLSGCRSGSWDNVKTEFDSYSRSYDAAVNSAISFSGLKIELFTRAKAHYIARILTERFGGLSQLELLDVGCGIGNIHAFFVGKVRAVTGVDISSECIATARQRNPWVDYRSYDGVRLPFNDARFDVAFTICVMHHVPPPQWPAFARELRRVVKPGGIALVFEHNPHNVLTRYVVSSCEFDQDAVLLPGGKTKQLLLEAGFTKVAINHILTVPVANQALQNVDRLFARLPLGAQYYALGIA